MQTGVDVSQKTGFWSSVHGSGWQRWIRAWGREVYRAGLGVGVNEREAGGSGCVWSGGKCVTLTCFLLPRGD